MSTLEERLARDVAAVAAGVVVTETDLREARAAVDERIGSRRRQGRHAALAVAAAAAVVAGAVVGVVVVQSGDGDDRPAPTGPTTPVSPSASEDHSGFLTGSAPTTELVEGVWRQRERDVTLLMRFLPDGEIWIDGSGALFSSGRALTGTYQIDGDVITVEALYGASVCAGNDIAVRASLPATGLMHVAFISPDNCFARPDREWVMEQVLPTSPNLATETFAEGAQSWPALEDAQLPGVWFATGGGHLLSLSEAGTYAVAGGSGDLVDQGRWSAQGSPVGLTLVSSVDSATCRAGDQLVLDDVRARSLGRLRMAGTVGRDDCGGDWAVDTWVQLSQ
jgi:hypothetical protein